MEDFGAVNASPEEVCRRKIAQSDILVCLVGHFYGTRLHGRDFSYSQFEYEEAKRTGKARLIFLTDDDFPLPARLGREPEEAYLRQLQFRDQVKRERSVVFFHDPQRLATLVVAALQTYDKETSLQQNKGNTEPASISLSETTALPIASEGISISEIKPGFSSAQADRTLFQEVPSAHSGAAAPAASTTEAVLWSLVDTACSEAPHELNANEVHKWKALLSLADSTISAPVADANQRRIESMKPWLLHLMRYEPFPVRERALAGKVLALLGDTRFDLDRWWLPKDGNLGFIEIPARRFLMGGCTPMNAQNDLPPHYVDLPSYWIGRFPVTDGQYRKFVEATGSPSRVLKGGLATLPVAGVSWQDAVSYCDWLTERLRELTLRGEPEWAGTPTLWLSLVSGRLRAMLPSEQEWFGASGAGPGSMYPWFGGVDANRANTIETGLGERTVVGCFPGGTAQYGVEDMCGNVAELTRSEYLGGITYLGGGFSSTWLDASCGRRRTVTPQERNAAIGFRVVLSSVSS
jgi:formylglycine-generating enzyme required for sulfatase activity